MSDICQKGWASGRVQGVGFRYHVARAAAAAGVLGYAKNLSDGRVEMLLQGDSAAVLQVAAAAERGPDTAQVEAVLWQTQDLDVSLAGFHTA